MLATTLRSFCLLITATLLASAQAAVEPGQTAPDFMLQDILGSHIGLAQFKGKTVVLEWNNPNCPFVRKHYGSSNMQGLQRASKDTAVWLVVNSTNPTSSDFMSAGALKNWMAEQKSAPSHYLLDPEGKVGRLYGAKTTPHMFVINPQGQVVYAGAIDDKRSSDPADIPSSNNYVRVALGAMAKGEAITKASTSPYGCSVKY